MLNEKIYNKTLDTYGDVEFNINDIENIAESTEENPPIIERYLIVLRG